LASFQEKLAAGWEAEEFVCVGIDPRLDMIPGCVEGKKPADKVLNFCLAVVVATGYKALAFKLNLAFFLSLGDDGILVLRKLCDTIRIVHPNKALILDGKFGDIGDANEAYAEFAFDVLGADAVTLNPYVGQKAHEPFLRRRDKGCIFLVKTSNPEVAELQDQPVVVQTEELSAMQATETSRVLISRGSNRSELKLHQLVAHRIAHGWNTYGNCAVVVSATYSCGISVGDLSAVRVIVGGAMPILIPGIGAQGGHMNSTLKEGRGSRRGEMIISASSGIIHASTGTDFATAANRAIIGMNTQILVCRNYGRSPA
jgi:orotidine-5'-phosphate decarboxylase